MGLAIGEPAAHGCPHSGSHVGVDHIHVERDVHERGVGHALERLTDNRLDPVAVEIGHGVDRDAEPADELALAVVEGAHADEEHVLRLHRRKRPGLASERLVVEP